MKQIGTLLIINKNTLCYVSSDTFKWPLRISKQKKSTRLSEDKGWHWLKRARWQRGEASIHFNGLEGEGQVFLNSDDILHPTLVLQDPNVQY